MICYFLLDIQPLMDMKADRPLICNDLYYILTIINITKEKDNEVDMKNNGGE